MSEPTRPLEGDPGHAREWPEDGLWMADGADTGPIEARDWCHVLPGEMAAEL